MIGMLTYRGICDIVRLILTRQCYVLGTRCFRCVTRVTILIPVGIRVPIDCAARFARKQPAAGAAYEAFCEVI
jgi:hypothetical protein